jgi:phage terminase large subunit
MGACQFIGKTMNWLNHYAAQGQEIGAHLGWLKSNGYTPGKAQIWLPHDGKKHDSVYNVSYESAFRAAGYDVEVVKNQGPGAAMDRVHATRRMFPAMYFDQDKCAAMLESLGWYHPIIDEHRKTDLGPDHDWSSHCCDLVGMAAITFDEPDETPEVRTRYKRDYDSDNETSWESA